MKQGVYNVTEYGIVGDGVQNATREIADLIQTVKRAGGGTLYFPPGLYTSGTVMLESNMTLYLEAGAVLQASGDPKDFPMVDSRRIPGWRAPTHAGFIAAIEAENVAVRGRGKLDGRGWFWWEGLGDHRPRSIQMISCDNVLIEGITIVNSPMWTVHPLCCNNVNIHGITIQNPYESPNTDGINPEGCSNVRISDCYIDVGDDCITLKSGKQDDLFIKQHPCQNIAITNCTMIHGHGAVVIGSEMSGGVKNVVISNCIFSHTDRGIRVKTRRLRGGTVEDIRMSNIVMDSVFCPIVLNSFYHCGTSEEEWPFTSSKLPQPVNEGTPAFRNFCFTGLTVKGVVAAACYVSGLPEMPVDGLTIDGLSVEIDADPSLEPQHPASTYDSLENPGMRGRGLFIHYARHVLLKNIRLKLAGPEVSKPGCPAVTLTDLDDLLLDGLTLDGWTPDSPNGGAPVLLERSQDAEFRLERLKRSIPLPVRVIECRNVFC